MRKIAIASIVLLATLVSDAASAASYTGHYKYVGNPALHSDARLQEALGSCDGAYGVQHATPSKSYQSCMLQSGWKFLYETRDKETAAGASDDSVKLAPGHFIDRDNGMDCQNFGGAEICDPPNGTVHYYDPDQGLPCTRTGLVSICM